MKTNLLISAVLLFGCQVAMTDTFRHRETGEEFYGFRSQKRTANKILVYHSEQKKMMTLDPAEYEITADSKGRRDNIVVVPIRQAESLISQAVAEQIAKAIVDASNTGPQFILLQIDSPGGRGEYMKRVAEAVQKTDNCPVVAYISGGPFGGAYSAAAAIALACDEIYIAPTAALGAIGPMVGSVTNEQYAGFLNLYSSDTLMSYSAYVMGLTQKQDLRLIARALVDKTVSVVEVIDADGKTHFVEREHRQPTQTIQRTLAEGAPRVTTAASGETAVSAAPSPAEIVGRTLTLTSDEALRIGLANKIVSSIAEIAAARGVPNTKPTNAPNIDAIAKRFTAARNSIGRGLAYIQQLETEASTLEEQIATVENQLRTAIVRRETGQTRQPDIARRGRVGLPGTYDDYYDYNDPQNDARRQVCDGLGRRTDTTRNRRHTLQTERTIVEEPAANLDGLRIEQAAVLRELISEYRSIINQARRWPGSLPPDMPIQVLESNMNSASALLDSINQMTGARRR